jgi:hypothetical protein
VSCCVRFGRTDWLIDWFMSSSLAVKRLALHISPSAHIAAQWCKGKCLSAPGARVATWPCHLCGLVSHLSSRSNRTSFQLPLPKDSISATLFSRPLPNALISSRGALSSRRVALPSRVATPHARCSCSARRPRCADDDHGIGVAHKRQPRLHVVSPLVWNAEPIAATPFQCLLATPRPPSPDG